MLIHGLSNGSCRRGHHTLFQQELHRCVWCDPPASHRFKGHAMSCQCRADRLFLTTEHHEQGWFSSMGCIPWRSSMHDAALVGVQVAMWVGGMLCKPEPHLRRQTCRRMALHQLKPSMIWCTMARVRCLAMEQAALQRCVLAIAIAEFAGASTEKPRENPQLCDHAPTRSTIVARVPTACITRNQVCFHANDVDPPSGSRVCYIISCRSSCHLPMAQHVSYR